MGEVLTDAGIYWGGYDLSGYANQVDTAFTRDEKEDSTFGNNSDGWRTLKPGAFMGQASAQCYWDTDIAETLHDLVGSDAGLIIARDGDFGSAAWCGAGTLKSLGFGEKWGEIAGSDPTFSPSGPLAMGEVMLAKAARASSGNGGASNLGAVGDGQILVAVIEVFAISGGTLTLNVQSDTAAQTSWTTRTSVSGVSALGAHVLTFPYNPANLDTYWRLNWVLSAGTVTMAAAFGICTA